MHNFSLVYNRVISPRLVNQVLAGVNYFKQVFVDFDTGFNPVAAGLNTGVTNPTLLGAPDITTEPPEARAIGCGLVALRLSLGTVAGLDSLSPLGRDLAASERGHPSLLRLLCHTFRQEDAIGIHVGVTVS